MFSFLIRLILLLIAVSLLRSVVSYIQRALGIGQTRHPPVRQPNPTAPSSTVLRQDPVCGTYVAVDSSLKKIVHGEVLHFCSPECRNRYTA